MEIHGCRPPILATVNHILAILRTEMCTIAKHWGSHLDGMVLCNIYYPYKNVCRTNDYPTGNRGGVIMALNKAS